MRLVLLSIATSLLVYSCSYTGNNSGNSKLDVSNAISVKPTILNTNKIHAELYDIRILDSILVLRSDDGYGYLQLFNRGDFKFIKTNGIKGKGPGELPNSMVEIRTINDTLYLFKLTTNSISFYDKESFVHDSLPLPFKEIVFQKYKGNFDILPLGNSFVSRPTIKTRFALYNNTGEFLDQYLEYPKLNESVDSASIDFIFRNYSITEPKPDKSKFVSLTFCGGILEIFEIKESKIHKLVEKIILDPNIKGTKDFIHIIKDDTNMGFYSVYTTDNYIYASYSGLSHKNFRKNNILLDYITVFDWDGQIKDIYKVEGGLLDLAIDESSNIIYIVTKNNMGDEVVGYFNINR